MQTPLPSAKHSKEHRAKLFSIYWRPWTLHRTYATSDVPHLSDSKRVPILARDTPVRELVRDTHIDRERVGKGAVTGAIKVD